MKYIWLVCIMCVSSVVACGSDSKCEQAASKLRACGLLGTGDACDDIPAEEAKEAECSSSCFLQADCKQLDEALCQQSSNAVETCVKSCSPATGTRINCGDGSSVSASSKCDGFDDCANGADEKGCKTIACKTGNQRVAEASKCDGFEDCADGSDELGCPQFKCNSGEMISLKSKCDGEEDCRDATDELGCSSDVKLICNTR